MKAKNLRQLFAGVMAVVMLLSSVPFSFGAIAAAEESGSYFKRILEVAQITASGNEGGNSKIENLINGSGMSDETINATHDAKSGGLNAWSTNQAEGTDVWIQVDFGEAVMAGAMYIWNNNHPGHTYRGLKNVKIETSLDGATWVELRTNTSNNGAYPYTFKQNTGVAGPATNLISGEPVAINKLIRYLKITADPVAGQGNYWTNQADKNDALSELRFIEMEDTTAEQDAAYSALKDYYALYEEEYTATTWANAEAEAKKVIALFNGESTDTTVIEKLQNAIKALSPSGKLHVNVLSVLGATAGSDAGGNSSVLNVINGFGMNGDGLDGRHNLASGAVGAWHTVGGATTGRTDAWIQFDMGKATIIGDMYVWNMSQSAGGRGMRNVKIETSLDGKAWSELRNADQMENTGSYPYQFAKCSIDQAPASNLHNGQPVRMDLIARYVRITADPTMANGSYGTEAYGLCEVRFGTMDEMSAQQLRIQQALARYSKKNSAFYTTQSFSTFTQKCNDLIALFKKANLSEGETTAALAAFEGAEAALQRVEMTSFYYDFSTIEGYAPIEDSTKNTDLSLDIVGGKLKVKGEQTKDGHGYHYTKIFSDLAFKVDAKSRLSYVISPKMDRIFNGDYPSQHFAIDLKFSDGTYLSDLGILDENNVEIHPDAQGQSKTQYMNGTPLDAVAAKYTARNLIIVRLGQWDQLIGKTVTDILVGYENEKGYDNYLFETSLDEISLEADFRTYEKVTDYVLTTAGTVNYMSNDSALGCYSWGKSAPFVALPHSFNLWSPMNVNATNQLRTIYNYERPYLKGFTCSHQANYHIGDLINWNFGITNGKAAEDTTFSRKNEIAKAHYYSVIFDQDSSGRAAGTKAELTTTDHGAAFRVTYDKSLATRGIILKGINDTITGKVSSLSVDKAAKTFTATVTATVNHGVDKMYLYGTFDQEVTSYDDTSVYFSADTVTMKVATSFISADQAKKNYDQELGNKTFMEVYTAAENAWLEKLAAIEIEGATENQLITFYTMLYRSYLYPNHMGEYTGAGKEDGWQYKGIYGDKSVQDGKLYYNNGFWDNYRTTWPLMTLLDPDTTAEMIEGLLCHYDDNGWIPRWTSAIGMDCMCGTSTDIIFGDAIERGVELDEETLKKAYEASLKNAVMSTFQGAAGGRDGLDDYLFKGYITDDAISDGNCALSWALAGYYNDYGIAQLAKANGDNDTYEYMMNRALGYVYMFDTEHEWFRGIEADAKTEWAEDLNPFWYDGDYMESFPFIMAFDAPFDGQGLLNLYGSKADMEEKLDTVFSTYGDLIWQHEENRYGGATHELLEVPQVKMGMYEHNNQPAHHLPYMYLFTDSPDKTQSTVRQILRQCYVNAQAGGGFIGDDDGGEQAAWYVFSALGLYPLNQGTGELAIGSPLFKKATIHLENGKDIVINAQNNSPENVYVESLKINGKDYDKTAVSQVDLMKGATLDFVMSDEPSDWGKGNPPSSITEGDEIPNPAKDQTNAAAVVTDKKVNVERIYSRAAADVATLFDDTAKTQTTLTPAGGKASVYYHFTSAKTIEMVTLTSGTSIANNPGAYALYGSNDGENWKLLEKTDGAPFNWITETKPMVVGEPGAYTDYRVDVYTDQAVTLAEIELMSKVQKDTAVAADRDTLEMLYQSASTLRDYRYTTDSWNAFNIALVTAKAVLAQSEPSSTALTEAFNNLQLAISNLVKSINLTKALTYQVPAGVTVTADNQDNGAASLAMDGDVTKNKKWCTNPGNGTHWLQIAFDSDTLVEGFALWNAGTEQAKFITDSFKVQMLDGSNWVDLYSTTGNTTDIMNITLDHPVIGKTFRLYITDCGADSHARIHEFHLFGKKVNNDGTLIRETLQKNYDMVADLNAYWYTDAAWSALSDAKAAAKSVLENSSADAAALLSAQTALQKAILDRTSSINYAKSLNYKIDSSKLSTDHSESAQPPANAMDGIVNQDASKWCSTQNDGDHWLVINFGKPVSVERWLVHNTGDGAAENRADYITTNMTLQVKRGSDWVDVDAVTNNTLAVVHRALAQPVVGEQFRLYVKSPCNTYASTSGQHILRIYEYHLFGSENAVIEDGNQMKEKAAVVDAKILEIGSNVTLESKAKIDAARAAYNALSEEEKGFVTKVDVLKNAESIYAQLNKEKTDREAAAAVDTIIAEIGSVTLQSGDKIKAARDAYNALNQEAKSYVTKVAILQDAEAAYAALKAEQDEQLQREAAAKVDAKILEIGKVTLDSKEKIDAAKAAYYALSDAEKSYVTQFSVLKEAEEWYVELKAGEVKCAELEEQIAAIGALNLSAVPAIKEAKEAYEALTDRQKELVKNASVLERYLQSLRAFEMGDVNMDERLSIGDIVTLLRYAAGYMDVDQFNYFVADVNNDGKIDTADVLQLIKIC